MQLIEKCRGTMQTQFDQWYSNLHARNGAVVNNHLSSYVGNDINSDKINAHNNSSSNGSGNNGNDRSGEMNGMSGSYEPSQPKHTSSSSSNHPPTVPALRLDHKENAHSSYSLGVAASGSQPINNNSNNQYYSHTKYGSVSNNNSNTATTTAVSVSAANNISRADSKHLDTSMDDDVNEDIMAFYQAKEELLKRRGAW